MTSNEVNGQYLINKTTNKTDVSGEACQKQPLPSHFEKIISGRKKQLL